MQKLIFLAGVSLLSLSLSTGAMALNPQPEPPGKSRVMFVPAGATLRTIGSATGGAGAGKVSDADDTYCGTKVPGHVPLVGARSIGNGALRSGAVTLNPQPLPPRIIASQTGCPR